MPADGNTRTRAATKVAPTTPALALVTIDWLILARRAKAASFSIPFRLASSAKASQSTASPRPSSVVACSCMFANLTRLLRGWANLQPRCVLRAVGSRGLRRVAYFRARPILQMCKTRRTLGGMAQETWPQYVARISDEARNVDISRAIGVSESTITRWRDGKLPTPTLAVSVARAYNQPPLEALVAAGYLAVDDVRAHVSIRFVPLSDVTDVELANELLDRAERAASLSDARRADPTPGDLATADEDALLQGLEP